MCIPNKGRLEGNAYIIINVYYQTKGIEGRQANKYSRKMRRVYVPKYFKPFLPNKRLKGNDTTLDLFDYGKIPPPILCIIVDMIPEDFDTLYNFSQTCRMNACLSIRKINTFRRNFKQQKLKHAFKFRNEMVALYSPGPGLPLIRCLVTLLHEKIHEGVDEELVTREVANAKKMIRMSDVFDINATYAQNDTDCDSNDYFFGDQFAPLHFAMCAEEEDLVEMLLEHPMLDLTNFDSAVMWSHLLEFSSEKYALQCIQKLSKRTEINVYVRKKQFLDNRQVNMFHLALILRRFNIIKWVIEHPSFCVLGSLEDKAFNFDFLINNMYRSAMEDEEAGLIIRNEGVSPDLDADNMDPEVLLASFHANPEILTVRDWAVFIGNNDMVQYIDTAIHFARNPTFSF